MLADVQVPAHLDGQVAQLGSLGLSLSSTVTKSCIAFSPLRPGWGDRAGGCARGGRDGVLV